MALSRLAAIVTLLLTIACGGARDPAVPARGDALRVDTLSYGRFGPVLLYRRHEPPSRVVLFISGDGGWNLGVVRMAEELTSLDAMVVGIDIRRYLGALGAAKESCSYPAGDFEALSQWIQQRLRFPAYVTPLLMGYSSGAALSYATLAQAPPGTFVGGVSLGFCPSLRVGRPLCRGYGLNSAVQARPGMRRFAPGDTLGAPWIVLQGAIDGAESRWMPQLRRAFIRVTGTPGAPTSPRAPEVSDLPLIELGPSAASRELAVVVSGDGGWAGIDRQIGQTFAAEGISVVGLNSLRYFWKPRTPEEAGADLARVLRHYLQAWNASRVLLVGYSRGADVLPFMVNRLPADLRSQIDVVALLGLSREAGFEFHFADLVAGAKGGRPTLPEMRGLRGLRVLCVRGTDETGSACRDLPPGLATVVSLPGGHHFGGAYRQVANRILESAQRRSRT